MKIGILGGTFNPVHIGHLILAEEAREKLKLDKVIFVVTNLAPHKDNSDVVPASHRYQMIKLAVASNRYFAVSDVEIKRRGLSYTIDTLKEFKRIYAQEELYFIIGSDLLKYLEEWKDLDEILRMVKVVVATRPTYPLEKIPAHISTLPIRAVDVSGFEVRQAIREGRSFHYLVPEPVLRYILRHRLYAALSKK